MDQAHLPNRPNIQRYGSQEINNNGFVGDGAVRFNDDQRRRNQLLEQNNGSESEFGNQESNRDRRVSIYCYIVGILLFVMTPFDNCD
mmetsp:Transcript_12759/g.21541  ORF Transcript_12759/g.21541 Transcript_12759/m.21541 type:complete len:87 (+) Transcript_12759:172-432(+)